MLLNAYGLFSQILALLCNVAFIEADARIAGTISLPQPWRPAALSAHFEAASM